MPLIPCSNAINECLPCDDDPVRNLSAEDPDVDRFIGIYNLPVIDGGVLLNTRFEQDGCKSMCYSEVSQDEADDCARRQAQECLSGGFFPPGSLTPVVLFYNTQQRYTVTCPDGTEFTWTIAAGQFVGLSQIQANQVALAVAKQRATLNRICILTSALGSCEDADVTAQIQAVGGTPLLFPYILGPQTPIGFNGCSGEDFGPVRYIWEVIAGSLPPGLELDECSGQLTGTPTASGSYQVTIRATDAIGSHQQKVITICVIEIDNASPLPDASEDVAYLENLTQTGGQQESEAWEIVSGSLPAGMTLTEAGVLSGTPLETGDFSFRVRVTVGTCS